MPITAVTSYLAEIRRLTEKLEAAEGQRKDQIEEEIGRWQRKIDKCLHPRDGIAAERAAHPELVPSE